MGGTTKRRPASVLLNKSGPCVAAELLRAVGVENVPYVFGPFDDSRDTSGTGTGTGTGTDTRTDIRTDAGADAGAESGDAGCEWGRCYDFDYFPNADTGEDGTGAGVGTGAGAGTGEDAGEDTDEDTGRISRQSLRGFPQSIDERTPNRFCSALLALPEGKFLGAPSVYVINRFPVFQVSVT